MGTTGNYTIVLSDSQSYVMLCYVVILFFLMSFKVTLCYVVILLYCFFNVFQTVRKIGNSVMVLFSIFNHIFKYMFNFIVVLLFYFFVIGKDRYDTYHLMYYILLLCCYVTLFHCVDFLVVTIMNNESECHRIHHVMLCHNIITLFCHFLIARKTGNGAIASPYILSYVIT